MRGGPLWAAALLSVASVRAEYYDGDMRSPSRENEHKIINGLDAELGQFPYHALLVMDGGSVCGGSLINVKSVLTAAHCVIGRHHTTVYLGGIRRTQPEPSKWIGVATYYKVYPHYNPVNLNDDIAIVPLPEAPPLTAYIKLVTLPSDGDVNETFVGYQTYFSGFGDTAYGGPLAEILQWTNLWVISNYDCARFYSLGRVIDSTLCTYGDNTGACYGDSGSPLVIASQGYCKQIGVLSFVPRMCQTDIPDGFVRVTSFLHWIRENW